MSWEACYHLWWVYYWYLNPTYFWSAALERSLLARIASRVRDTPIQRTMQRLWILNINWSYCCLTGGLLKKFWLSSLTLLNCFKDGLRSPFVSNVKCYQKKVVTKFWSETVDQFLSLVYTVYPYSLILN